MALAGLPCVSEVEVIRPSISDAVELFLDERADGNIVERRNVVVYPTALEQIASHIDGG